MALAVQLLEEVVRKRARESVDALKIAMDLSTYVGGSLDGLAGL